MKDRIPTPGQEGRMLITPENGDPPFYATVAMADNPSEDGTPLNKANLLTDATAALFGLSVNAVPNDVLRWVGKYNQHWWTKREYTPPTFTLGEVISGSSMSIGNSFTYSCSYSDTIEVGHNGTVELAGNVTTESFTGVSQAQKIFDSIKGKYFKTNVTNYTYIAYRTQTSAITGSGTIAVPHQKVTGQPSVIGAMLSYEISNEPDTFPVNDAVDSVWYTYLGVPFDNAVAAPKIQTGSYIGTGTYGKENPNTLSFNFLVKLILITGSWGNDYTQRYTAILNVEAGTYSGLDHIGNHAFSGTIVRNDDEVSWYNNYNAAGQGNVANSNYTYIAIG